MTKSQFGSLMGAMNAAYPAEKITQNANKVRLWWEMLEDVEYSVAARNLQRHIKTNKYVPTIAEIRGSKASGFNNFTGRNYDMQKLELALLGVCRNEEIEDVKEGEMIGETN